MDAFKKRRNSQPKHEYPEDLSPSDCRLKKDPYQQYDDYVDVKSSEENFIEESESISFSTSYCGEWEKLFSREDCSEFLRSYAMQGKLRSCRFRSICWKIYLEVLPGDINKWAERMQAWRDKYDHLKNTLDVNPRQVEENITDLKLHNPLSQDENSPWNQFFQDHELRCTIAQDVIRTCPDVPFFRDKDLHRKMTNVLFCYAKLTHRISYRQGMHELLAPLIFVLHCDHQAFEHACEIEQVGKLMQYLLNPLYIEHDAFAMFCQIMEVAQYWYVSKEISPPYKKTSLRSEPFVRAFDPHPSNVIVAKLSRIQNYLLRREDPLLHDHLTRLEILPQVYGIRWLRLLFGREFPMQDLLVLWDAIFADSFDLVDYIFLAMLLYLRDALLSSDMSTCLHLLMKFPPIGDVNYFIQKALYLREPNVISCPATYMYQKPANLAYAGYGNHLPTSINGLSMNLINNLRQANREHKSSFMSGFSTLGKKFGQQKKQGKSGYSFFGQTLKKATSEVALAHPSPSPESYPPMSYSTSNSRKGSISNLSTATTDDSCTQQYYPRTLGGVSHAGNIPVEQGVPADQLPNTHRYDVTLPRSPADSPHLHSKKIIHHARNSDLEQRVSFLLGRITDMDAMCHRCAEKMDVHIDKLQTTVLRRSYEEEDELLLALAGLKQVRDVLKGVLRPSNLFPEEAAHHHGYHSHSAGPDSPASPQTNKSPAKQANTQRSVPPKQLIMSSPDSGDTKTGSPDSTLPSSTPSSPYDDPPRTPSAILTQQLRGQKEVEMQAFKNLSPDHSIDLNKNFPSESNNTDK